MVTKLFDGNSTGGWGPRPPASQHVWQAVAAVSLDPDDGSRFAIDPGSGVLYNGPAGNTADLVSSFEHGDCVLSLEFCIPKGSNSGVYLMGRYEIQILDSYGKGEPTVQSCGAIYPRWIDERNAGGTAPHANLSRPPGEWQTYEVEFESPRFEGGTMVRGARIVRVVWNGEVAHEDVLLEGPTRGALFAEDVPTGPLMLQGDHGPVAYRNITIESR